MGSLILLLLVATNRIRAAAVEKARQAALKAAENPEPPTSAESPPPVVTTEPEPEEDHTAEWLTQVEQLTAERDTLRNRLAELKTELDKTQAAVLRSKVKAVSAKDRLQEIRQQKEELAAEELRLRSEINSLQSDLTAAEQRLTKAVERQKTASSKFAFLPFDGRTGTTKRPILIECTQEYIRFLPEDVRLMPQDLNGFTSGFNPLLVASRELIHYWKAYDLVHESASENSAGERDSFETDLAALKDKEREPYVLLLVRPSGAVAFHIAKAFLTQLKVPHGYELITDDMELDTATPDADAKRICEDAVAQVLAEREKVVELLARNRELKRDLLELEPSARTFVPKETAEPRVGSRAASRPAAGEAGRGTLTSNGRGPTSANAGLVSNAGPKSGGPNSAMNQTNLKSGQPGRLATDLPPEEPLPQPATRRYENDDTKPFPMTAGERPKSNASNFSNTVAAAPGGQREPSTRSRPSPNSQTAGGQRGDSTSANMARMKRRYSMPRAGIGLEKAIPIRVWPNRIVIGGEFEIPVEAGVRTESLIDRTLMAIDRVQSDWPSAGEGYHWVPTIKYEVLPGGEQVQQRLNAGLFDLGLVSSVEYLKADPESASQPTSSRETSRSRAAKSASGGSP